MRRPIHQKGEEIHGEIDGRQFERRPSRFRVEVIGSAVLMLWAFRGRLVSLS